MMLEITKEIAQQYEAIRQSGVINMLLYRPVMTLATWRGYEELAKLTPQEYADVLNQMDAVEALISEYGYLPT